MNILFISLLDFSSLSERNIYTDLLRTFANKGNKVYIISPIETRKKSRTEVIELENVKIIKPLIGRIQKTNLIEKGLTTLSLEKILTKTIKKNFKEISFDLVLYSTPPITLVKPIKYIKKRDKAKSYLLLKDIFPQNAIDLELMQKKSFLHTYFRYKERKLYQISDYIGCMSKRNVEYILNHNLFLSKDNIEVCPNSIEPRKVINDMNQIILIRERYGLPINKKIFIYGGNLGKPQGIDFLMDCIRLNETNKESFFLIIGTGTEFNKLSLFFTNNMFKNSMLLNFIPVEDYELLVNSCDVGLIFLDKRFTIPNIPSRILSYMESSMPVLAATDKNTDLSQIISEGELGYCCESKDAKQFNNLVNKMCDEKLIKQMGINSRNYLEENYTVQNTFSIIMSHFN